jgi:hypothetical protein
MRIKRMNVDEGREAYLNYILWGLYLLGGSLSPSALLPVKYPGARLYDRPGSGEKDDGHFSLIRNLSCHANPALRICRASSFTLKKDTISGRDAPTPNPKKTTNLFFFDVS